jgi:hypothetical protein
VSEPREEVVASTDDVDESARNDVEKINDRVRAGSEHGVGDRRERVEAVHCAHTKAKRSPDANSSQMLLIGWKSLTDSYRKRESVDRMA